MANIDFQLLRDWYNSQYYTSGQEKIRKGRLTEKTSLAGKQFTKPFWQNYIFSRPIEIDPRVKYRVANKAAVDEIIRGGEVGGTVAYSSIEGVPSLYFSQGIPLHQYAESALQGAGTAHSPQSPYLIATIGDDWATRRQLNKVKPSDVNIYGLEDALAERGITEDIHADIRQAQSDLFHLRDALKRVKTSEEFEGIIEKIQDLESEIIPKVSDAVNFHLDPDQYQANDYWDTTKQKQLTLPQFLGLEDSELESILRRGSLLPSDFNDLEVEADSYVKDYRAKRSLGKHIDEKLRYYQGLLDTIEVDPKKLKQFFPTAGKSSSGENWVYLPEWINHGDYSMSLESEDTELMKKIASGKATPEEIDRVYGLGALKGFGGGSTQPFLKLPKSGSKAGHMIPAMGVGLGAADTEILPRAIIPNNKNVPTWSIPSPYLGLENYRPFAVWQYTKGGLRLIEEGNNDPVVGGVKPIPTGIVDPDLISKEFIDFWGQKNLGWGGKFFRQNTLGLKNVNEAVRDFNKTNWLRKGFADTSFVTRPFSNLADYLKPEPIPMPNFNGLVPQGTTVDTAATIRNAYLNDPSYRTALNSQALRGLGKLATAATVALSPFDAVSRRDAMLQNLVDQGGTIEDVQAAWIPYAIGAGLETTGNIATFGAYDALINPTTRKKYYTPEELMSMGRQTQIGIDYPVFNGQIFERTTK